MTIAMIQNMLIHHLLFFVFTITFLHGEETKEEKSTQELRLKEFDAMVDAQRDFLFNGPAYIEKMEKSEDYKNQLKRQEHEKNEHEKNEHEKN